MGQRLNAQALGEPVSLETSYYPAAVAGLLLETDLGDRSVPDRTGYRVHLTPSLARLPDEPGRPEWSSPACSRSPTST